MVAIETVQNVMMYVFGISNC